MKIDNLHIDGFGVWNDKTWGPLAPGLNVFHGPNETGKSTLMAFVRSILFGLDRRGQARRYEPLNGGTHGGWLDVSVDGRPVRIERKAGKHVRGTVTDLRRREHRRRCRTGETARRYHANPVPQRLRVRPGRTRAVSYAAGHRDLAAHLRRRARHWRRPMDSRSEGYRSAAALTVPSARTKWRHQCRAEGTGIRS